MGRITDEDIQRVRDATDLVDLVSETVVLKRKSRLFWGCCPFHGEKTPSFKIDPATQLWHCFGCGLGGDAFGFTMRTENLDFPDAVRALASRSNIDIVELEGGAPAGSRDRLYAVCDAAAAFYHRALLSGQDAGSKGARAYLGARDFGSEVAKRFELGYAPGRGVLSRALREQGFAESDLVEANVSLRAENGGLRDRFYERVMFPIRDVQGRCVGFGGRVLGSGEPKYLNTQETPVFHKSRHLYGIDRARNEIVKEKAAIVVEGYTDVIALSEAGVANVVATLGTALTREHMKLLGRFARRIVYLFDGDEAGLRAADRAVEFIGFDVTPEAGSERIDLDVALLPGDGDPADFVAAHGADAVRSLVEGAVPLLRFALDRRLAKHDLTRPEGRSSALADAASVLAAVKGSLLAHDYTNYLADRLLVDFATVQQALAAAKPIPGRSTGEQADQKLTAPPTPRTGASSPEARAERELLGLLVANPRLRREARFLLTEDLLSETLHAKAMEVITGNPDSGSEDLVALVQQSDPEVAALLAGVSVEGVGEADAATHVSELLSKLKEFALDRQILLKKAQLKALDPKSDPDAYDRLFRNVSALQRERDILRSARSNPSDTEH